jgi:hypothetical protein
MKMLKILLVGICHDVLDDVTLELLVMSTSRLLIEFFYAILFQTPQKKPVKKVIQGGIAIEILKEGHGPEAKYGKTVSMKK